MLLEIERGGMDAVRQTRSSSTAGARTFRDDPRRARRGARRRRPRRPRALQLGHERVKGFAELQLASVSDVERSSRPACSSATATSRSAASAPTCPPGASR